MKPFTLHAVLNYRRQLENRALHSLTQALELETKLKEAFQTAENELAGLYADLQRDQEQGTSIDRLLLFNQRIDLVKEQVQHHKTALEKGQAQVTQKRQVLLRASKDRRIMEKMEEQQNAAYKRHLEKLEVAMLDEIAILSHERTQW